MKKKTKIVVGTAIICLLVVVISFTMGCRHTYSYRRQAYNRQLGNGRELIESLRTRSPSDTSADTWDCAIGCTMTAYVNICFSEECVSYDELVLLNKDLSRKFNKKVTLNTIDWTWERLAKTGPHGVQYISRFEPMFRYFVYGETEKPQSP